MCKYNCLYFLLIFFLLDLFPTSALTAKRKSLVDYEHSFFDRIQIDDFDSSEDVKVIALIILLNDLLFYLMYKNCYK
jgi:hypothetical protein